MIGCTDEIARANSRSLAAGLLYVTVVELVLLGSGRLLQVGPVTFRMALFGLGLVVAIMQIFARGAVDRQCGLLVASFGALLLISTVVGSVNGASVGAIASDVKPLLFFFGLLFFAETINSAIRVRRVAAVIRISALALAVLYLIILGIVAAGLAPFGALYAVASTSDEFFFRGESGGFFYKGFLYLGVGFFFWVLQPKWRDKCVAVILLIAVVLTFTRGLLLAIIAVSGLTLFARQQNAVRSAAVTALLLSASLAAWPLFRDQLASRSAADSIRRADIQAVATETTVPVVVFGRGFGTTIGSRARIEESYLEIFYKQGVLGLAFWFVLLTLLTLHFRNAARAGLGRDALPFFMGALFVFVESAANPFLTNPIGMSTVLIAFVAVRALTRSTADRAPACLWPELNT